MSADRTFGSRIQAVTDYVGAAALLEEIRADERERIAAYVKWRADKNNEIAKRCVAEKHPDETWFKARTNALDAIAFEIREGCSQP